MNRLSVLAAILLLLTIPTILASEYTNVTVSEAKAMIDSNLFSVVLDVRTQSEYDSGHIRKAKHIPVSELQGRLGELNVADDILVYCKSGGRSATASQILVDNGFSHVYNMLGGIDAWNFQGYPVFVKYSSIQEAVNNAAPGDTLLVSLGIYYENVVVNKTVSLIGEDRSATIIDGSYTGTVVEVEAPNVTLADFTIQKSSPSLPHCGIYLSSDNNNITFNIIRNNLYGIKGSSDNSIIARNNITLSDEDGVSLSSSSGNIISSNILRGNHEGISIFQSSRTQITRNTVEENIVGISLSTSSNNTVRENTARDNEHGIWIHFSSNNVISENDITTSSGAIWLTNSTFNTMLHNTIIGANFGGIHLERSSNNTAYENTVNECGFGIRLGNSTSNTFFHNNLLNNTQQTDFYWLNFTNTWDNGREGNYWSDQNNTDSDGNGIGDTPYIINENNQDNYPLMNLRWNPADVNHDLKVDIYDAVLFCGAYLSTPSDPRWNPLCDIAEPLGVIDIYDVVLMCGHYGEEFTL